MNIQGIFVDDYCTVIIVPEVGSDGNVVQWDVHGTKRTHSPELSKLKDWYGVITSKDDKLVLIRNAVASADTADTADTADGAASPETVVYKEDSLHLPDEVWHRLTISWNQEHLLFAILLHYRSVMRVPMTLFIMNALMQTVAFFCRICHTAVDMVVDKGIRGLTMTMGHP